MNKNICFKTFEDDRNMQNKSILNKTFDYIKRAFPIMVLVIADLFFVVASLLLALKINFPFPEPNFGYLFNPDVKIFYIPMQTMGGMMAEYFFGLFILFVATNTIFGCYTSSFKHFGMADTMRNVFSVLSFTLILLFARYLFPDMIKVHFRVLFTMVLLLLLLSLLFRASVRLIAELHSRLNSYVKYKSGEKIDRVLIYGAGEAGIYLCNKIKSGYVENLRAIAFIDDNPSLQGKTISRLKVFGTGEKLAKAIEDYNIDEVIVAIPTASKMVLKGIVDVCSEHKCKVRRFGSMNELDISENTAISQINLEELLRRDSVKLNMDVVRKFIEGKTVLVTGGAGSIGSEICRQVLSFGCKKLIVFDIHENGLFDIENEFKQKHDHSKFVLRLGSIRDKNRLDEVFTEFSPELVFHAAAHKHVPMMEYSPREAIKNNAFGTINVAQAAILHGAEKFILISTDKAVNPTNIMGASKRIAERSVQLLDTMSDTDLSAVRFGNVLGSNGSVVPFFKKQIEAGGPVTVTDKKMTRYFMTIPEAVQLVLEAGAMANGGEIFVLNMGEPVKIYDLACDMIRLSGYEPDVDIKIDFIGLRPGEKLYEEISMENEDATKTPNDKIFIMKPMDFDPSELSATIKELESTIPEEDIDKMFNKVQELVPTFNHNTKGKEGL